MQLFEGSRCDCFHRKSGGSLKVRYLYREWINQTKVRSEWRRGGRTTHQTGKGARGANTAGLENEKKKCKEADRRAEIIGTDNGEGSGRSELGDGREQKCDLTSSFGSGTQPPYQSRQGTHILKRKTSPMTFRQPLAEK